MKNKLTKKHIILIVFGIIFFYIVSAFLVNFLRIEVKRGSWRQHHIDSFAGCFDESKSSWKSYKNMNEQEITDSLKELDISKKEFEYRKDECIKESQLMSFAGCKKTEYKWKKWNEMSDGEFDSALEYFDINKKSFDYMKDGCENGNWE